MDQLKLIIDDLTKKGIISQDQLDKVTEESKARGLSLDKILIKQGLVKEDDMAGILSDHIGIPFMDLSDYLVDSSVIKLVPEAIALKYKLIPLFKIADTVTVAMVNPQDINAIDQYYGAAG